LLRAPLACAAAHCTYARIALLLPQTLSHLHAKGHDPRALLDSHRSYDAFEAAGGLIVTGPTLTNVNDVRIVLVG
jgi:hydroxypyruvate reductase